MGVGVNSTDIQMSYLISFFTEHLRHNMWNNIIMHILSQDASQSYVLNQFYLLGSMTKQDSLNLLFLLLD